MGGSDGEGDPHPEGSLEHLAGGGRGNCGVSSTPVSTLLAKAREASWTVPRTGDAPGEVRGIEQAPGTALSLGGQAVCVRVSVCVSVRLRFAAARAAPPGPCAAPRHGGSRRSSARPGSPAARTRRES